MINNIKINWFAAVDYSYESAFSALLAPVSVRFPANDILLAQSGFSLNNQNALNSFPKEIFEGIYCSNLWRGFQEAILF